MNVLAFGMYVVVTIFTLGPNNLMAMSNGLHTGFQRTLRFLGGVFAGFIVVMLVCGFANFAFMTLLPSLHQWLNLFGAGYMIYLAYCFAPSSQNMTASSTSPWDSCSTTLRLQV